ncbi:NYN domain-containing protein [Halomicroarcula sp. F28]|uniref:NYN domain-containing protein n=1 Tax=Haloarcula salinisoli TaxID=2487746 RepID=UPI001C7342F1|nr:NYN domain-containing protein [Halomicroarcula salinisoli]MBX0287315.1 NYN domain-containing protein [Halomicroarcula salinisoli]
MSLLSRFRDDRDDTDRVGLYVDGPNVLRSEFDVDLDEVRKIGESYGPLAVTRLYLDENASPGLIQAGEARGFEVITTSGDVDVRLAVDATEAVASDRIDVLVVASRDTDFKPALEVAARRGVRTVALAPGEHGKSDALQNAAQDGLSLSADVE